MYMTEEYRRLNRQLHQHPRGFGHSGRKHASEVLVVTRLLKGKETGTATILDYGCGGGTLAVALKNQPYIHVYEYDPAVPGKDHKPQSADVVVCTDVMEHVEPEYVNLVIDHVLSLAERAAFFVISTIPSSKSLSDGRNAHLSVHTADEWRYKFRGYLATWREESLVTRIDRTLNEVGELSMWLVKREEE